MKENNTLLDRAMMNFIACRDLQSHIADDDIVVNIVAYHLQQTAELYLKHYMEISGVEYPRTHDISDLLQPFETGEAELSLTPEQFKILSAYADTLSKWEDKTRNIKNFMANAKKVVEIYNFLAEVLGFEVLKNNATEAI